MILEGAKGSCAQEISEALRIPNIKQKGVRTILMGILNALKVCMGSLFPLKNPKVV